VSRRRRGWFIDKRSSARGAWRPLLAFPSSEPDCGSSEWGGWRTAPFPALPLYFGPRDVDVSAVGILPCFKCLRESRIALGYPLFTD
jgi:hypothetical protein